MSNGRVASACRTVYEVVILVMAGVYRRFTSGGWRRANRTVVLAPRNGTAGQMGPGTGSTLEGAADP